MIRWGDSPCSWFEFNLIPGSVSLADKFIDSLVQNYLPTLLRLASLPFEQEAHEALLTELEWSIHRESDWPETEFVVNLDEARRRLVATYDPSGPELGIGLYVLDEEAPTWDEVGIRIRHLFDKRFEDVLQTALPLLPDPNLGAWVDPSQGHRYRYAHSVFEHSFLVVLQHPEGDANYGSIASIDIRIVPRGDSGILEFPIESDILF